jgi:hypothetical protein
MKRLLAFLLFVTPAIADSPHDSQGRVVSGTVSGSDVVSPAATVEIQGSSDVGLSLARSGTANTTDENFIAYFAKDSNGVYRKLASISSIWGDTSATYGVVRYNASYTEKGVGKDDLSIQQHGGKGVTLCGVGGNDTPPGPNKLMVRCNTWLMGDVQLEQSLGLADGLGEPACKTGIAQLYVGTDHKLKIKMGNCAVLTVVTQ